GQRSDSGERFVRRSGGDWSRCVGHRCRCAGLCRLSAETNPGTQIPNPKSRCSLISVGIWVRDSLRPERRQHASVSDFPTRLDADVKIERRIALRNDLDMVRAGLELQRLEYPVVIIHTPCKISVYVHISGAW